MVRFRGVVRLGGGEVVVGVLAGDVYTESDKSDPETRGGVAEVIYHHRVAPPLIPPPEELSRWSQRFRHWWIDSFRSLLLSLSIFLLSRSKLVGSRDYR